MNSAMHHTTLATLCTLVTDGTHDSPKLIETGVPFIKGKHISGGRIDFASCDYISHEDHLAVIARSKPERGDTLFSNIGSVGDAAYVDTDQEFSIKNIALFKPDSSKIDPKYLFYLLRSDSVRNEMLAAKSGSAQPFISLGALRSHQVKVHSSVETQRRIASILGAYDDLIEVNRLRIAVLEEMARGVFEEWFVRFRFPGHEVVPILDTPDGPLPEGWISQTVGETFELLGGGTPSKAEPDYWVDGIIDWFTPSDLTRSKTLFMDRSSDRITPLGLAKSSAKLFPADSIMMTSRATIGEISICTGSACTNQGFITCLPNEVVPRSYLYFWLSQNVPTFIAHATGATFKEITKGVFKRLPITIPPQVITGQFDALVRPMHNMTLALERSNRSLTSSRDLLLPRLISGQLSVAEAEGRLEEAA